VPTTASRQGMTWPPSGMGHSRSVLARALAGLRRVRQVSMALGHGVRRRTPGRSGRRWRRLALTLVIGVSGTSIVGYVALSFTVNGLPPYRPFPGWVAVLQPDSRPDGDEVQLLVQSDAAAIPWLRTRSRCAGRVPIAGTF
jgi:hypothetical protein